MNDSPVLTEGDPAPAFTLETVGGDTLALADLIAEGQCVLLVFLRHLG